MPKLIVQMGLMIIAAGAAQAQQAKQQPQDVWNKVYTNARNSKLAYSDFLAEIIKGRKPGKALPRGGT